MKIIQKISSWLEKEGSWDKANEDFEISGDGNKIPKKVTIERKSRYEKLDLLLKFFSAMGVIISLIALAKNISLQTEQNSFALETERGNFELSVYDKAISVINNITETDRNDSLFTRSLQQFKSEILPRIQLLNYDSLTLYCAAFKKLAEDKSKDLGKDSIGMTIKRQYKLSNVLRSQYFKAKPVYDSSDLLLLASQYSYWKQLKEDWPQRNIRGWRMSEHTAKDITSIYSGYKFIDSLYKYLGDSYSEVFGIYYNYDNLINLRHFYSSRPQWEADISRTGIFNNSQQTDKIKRAEYNIVEFQKIRDSALNRLRELILQWMINHNVFLRVQSND